jgi:hypothetical protein
MQQDLSLTALPFIAGLMCGLVIFMITMFCTLKDFEPRETAGDLFESENISDEDDDFMVFIVTRLAQSSAFRTKIVNGVAKLHNTYPKIYAEVMRP